MVGDGAILCAGRLYCDLVFSGVPRLPELGTEVFCEGLTLAAGGGAFITAAWATALGRPATLFALRPAEPFGAMAARALIEAGVSDATAPSPPGTDPQLTVAIPHGGDRAFLTRRPGAALPDAPLPTRARHLHVGEIATLAERPGLIDEARAAGMSVSADCAWDDEPPANAAALIAALDLFLPNEGEAARLEAHGIALDPARTVVKRGPDGASSHGGRHRRAGPKVTVVDATGAGDAFDAGYLDAWLGGAPRPRRASRRAMPAGPRPCARPAARRASAISHPLRP